MLTEKGCKSVVPRKGKVPIMAIDSWSVVDLAVKCRADRKGGLLMF